MSKQKSNIQHHILFSFHNVTSIMKELHILITPNKEHKKVFLDMTTVKPLRTSWLETNYPNLRRAKNVNHVENLPGL